LPTQPAERLDARLELRALRYLEPGSPLPTVNAFLAAVNEAFLRGPLTHRWEYG
jgi:hypothetical protein